MFQLVISQKSFDPEVAHKVFRESVADCGAITAFTGLVRAEQKDDENGVDCLSLTHYPGFTEKQIEKIASEARSRWDLGGLYIIHRVGELKPAEPIVFVAAASQHRRESFEAADYVMDYLKSEAPFWKRETRGQMKTWIEPRDRDITDKKRWSQS